MAKNILIYFDMFYEKLVCSGLHPARSKDKFSLMICIGIFLAFGGHCGERRNSLKKRFLSENVIFRGLSQLQNGVSTSPLPPFIVDLLTFKDYPRSN